MRLFWHIHWHKLVKTIGRWEYRRCRCGHKKIDVRSTVVPVAIGEETDQDWLEEDREPIVRCWHCKGKGSIWGYASATAAVKSNKNCSRCKGRGVL